MFPSNEDRGVGVRMVWKLPFSDTWDYGWADGPIKPLFDQRTGFKVSKVAQTRTPKKKVV